MQKFPNTEASVGGQISIDIYEKGANKAQILNEINDPIYFFGDKMEEGGNDYPIAERLKKENRKHYFDIHFDISTLFRYSSSPHRRLLFIKRFRLKI